jgi:4a-hydroxytetrahydrobiopterin dehydratase
MPAEKVYTEEEIQKKLQDELPGWEYREGWIRRTFLTPGFAHTLLLANAIGYIAEAAWHHPDLTLGFARVTVKLQTHAVRGITDKDFELAKKIEEVALWRPPAGSALPGYPKVWVRPETA